MRKQRIGNFFRFDLWILILDVIIFNASYFLALVIRFYINGHFLTSLGHYREDWIAFAPYYTVIALVIFFCFRMYGGMWAYAGLNDLNRLIFANAATAIVMIIGTAVFVNRMPITYYVIGAGLQFMNTAFIRFLYRIVKAERKKLRKNVKLPVLVIGSGELGQKVMRNLDEGGAYQPVAVIGKDVGRTLDGVPVYSYDHLAEYVEKVQEVFIADKDITPEQQEQIHAAAGSREIHDYTGMLSNMTGAVPVTGLLETISGPVTIAVDGGERTYPNGLEALGDLHARYLVTGIRGDKLTVELVKDDGTAYLKQHLAETGEEPSFF